MDKYKYLVKNTLIFFIGSFTSKVLVFLLLPLYTTVLSTTEYAISDLMNTSVNLLFIILTLMISEGVLRFAIENRYDKAEILNIGFVFIIMSSIVLGICILVVSKINYIPMFDGYWVLFFLLYIFYSLNHLLAGFVRGIENVKLIAITGVFGTGMTVASNIILLVVFKYGISGYITSMILSNAINCVMYIVFGKVYKYFNIKSINSKLLGEMIKYSLPIVITEMAWWINSAADRYMVAWLLGASETGLLSVSHKLPSVLTIFTSIFMQAWKLSAIKEYKSESSQQFFSKMLNLYNALLILAGALVITFIKPISALAFKGDFSNAWYLVSPFIIAFVINGVSAFLGSFYIANKDTKSLMNSTLIGAAINIILNYLMIKEVGTIGAGISTVISYFIISLIRIIQVKREIKIHLELKRIVPSYILLVLLAIIVSVNIKYVYYIAILILVMLVWLNSKYILEMIRVGRSYISKRMGGGNE